MKLFSKSWINDLPWIELAIYSVARKCQEPVDWTIAIEDEHLEGLWGAIRSAQARTKDCEKISFHVHGLNEKWPEARSIPGGYERQQWIKMTSHRVMGEGVFWHWDSDLMAINNFTSKIFTAENGRPIYWFTPFNDLVDKANPMAGIERRNMLKEVFQIQEPSFEWMRCLPIPSHGAILKHFETRPEYARCFEMMKKGDKRFSEFNVIGQFSLTYFPDAFEWRNTNNYPHTWGGAWGDPDATVCQQWSWGGCTEEFKQKVYAL